MKAYNRIDKKIHQLSQVIAKVNRSLVPEKEDDSHTNLYFESIERRIYGRWFQQNDTKYILALDLYDFTFQLIADNKEIIKQFQIEGKNLAKIETEIADHFKTLNIRTDGLMKKLHFEIPAYAFIDSVWVKPDNIEMSKWLTYRSLANEICMLVLGLAQAKSEIRIWPHHFDTGIYCKVKSKLGVGFGLAMEDEMVNDSYFYISAYPEDYKIEYDNLPKGNWAWKINENYKGAILTLKELDNRPYEEKRSVLIDYITTTYSWIIRQ
mgnify:CR=1 FL=1